MLLAYCTLRLRSFGGLKVSRLDVAFPERSFRDIPANPLQVAGNRRLIQSLSDVPLLVEALLFEILRLALLKEIPPVSIPHCPHEANRLTAVPDLQGMQRPFDVRAG